MKLKTVILLVALLLSLALPVLAAIPYNASDVVGQTDFDGNETFTKGYRNNKLREYSFFPENALALDTVNHRLFVGDYNGVSPSHTINGRVLVYNLDNSNNLIDHIPDNVLGQADLETFAADSASASDFLEIGGLFFDSTNNRLFVSDRTNNRILIFDTTTIADGEAAVNVLGQTDFTTTSSGLTQGKLSGPRSMSFNPSNNLLFVADGNNRIMIFDLTAITDGENAVNVLGQADFTSGAAATTQAGLSSPWGTSIDVTGNRLFVVESGNSRVVVYDVAAITDGENAANVLGKPLFTTGGQATTQSRLWSPRGVWYDAGGNRLYVADFSNNRVMVFDVAAITDGENAVNVLGFSNYTTQTYPGDSGAVAGLDGPSGVVYDSANNRLLVSQESFLQFRFGRVSMFDLSSVTNGESAVNFLGQEDGNGNGYGRSLMDGPKANGLQQTCDAIVDNRNHRLYVADTHNRVLVFNLDANDTLLDGTADNVLGQTDFVSNTAATTQSGLDSPCALAFDSTNNRLFVTDQDNSRVMVFDVASITNGENAINVLGATDFVSDIFDITQNNFDFPVGVAYDPTESRLFVGDCSNTRIMVFDVASITDGENAINVLGSTDFTSSNFGSTTQNEFDCLWGLSYDDEHNRLFAADEANNRVLVFDVTAITNGENAINVLGQTNFTNSGTGLTQSTMNEPTMVVYDADTEVLFVSDSDNLRILAYDVAAITDGENAVSVLGQSNFTSAAGPNPSQSRFSEILSVALDETNHRLYVSETGTISSVITSSFETGGNRVLIYDLVNLAADSAVGDGTTGVAYTEDLTSGSQGTVTYNVDSGVLPTGLSIVGDDLAGTPTVAGTYAFTLTATDTVSAEIVFKDTKSYSVDIVAGGGGGGGGQTTTSSGSVPRKTIAMLVEIFNNKPKITLKGPAFLRVNRGETFVDPGVTVEDAEDGVLTNVVTTGAVDTDTPGIYPITYTVTDSGGEQSVVGRQVSVEELALAPAPAPIAEETEVETTEEAVEMPKVSEEETESEEASATTGNSPSTSRDTVGSRIKEVATSLSATLDTPWARTLRDLTVAISGFISVIALIGSIRSGPPLLNHLAYVVMVSSQFLGITRAARPWGVVYDSQTKRPIQYARVEILNEKSRKLDATVTDQFGRYGFLVSDKLSKAETFELKAYQENYIFPSLEESTFAEQALYFRVYRGGPIRADKDITNYDLPMDPKTFQPFKNFRFGINSVKLSRLLSKVTGLIFVTSVILAVAFAIDSPNVPNLLVLAVVVLTSLFRKSGFKMNPFGITRDALKKQVMPYGFLALNDLAGKRASFTVSDSEGRYFLLSPIGRYLLKAQTPAHIIPPRTKELPISTKEGWISREIVF